MAPGQYLGVPRRNVFVRPAVFVIRVGAVRPDAVDMARNDQGEDLLPGPEGAGLQDGRLGDFAVPRGKEHQEVHHLPLKKSREGGMLKGTELNTQSPPHRPQFETAKLPRTTALMLQCADSGDGGLPQRVACWKYNRL